MTLTRRADRRLPSAADRRAPGIAGKIAEASLDRHSVGVPREQASAEASFFYSSSRGCIQHFTRDTFGGLLLRRGESETMIAAEGGSEQFEDGGFALLPRHTKVRASPDRGESRRPPVRRRFGLPSSRAERAGLILCLSVPRVSSRARATRVATPHPRGQSASIESYRKSTRLAAPRICSVHLAVDHPRTSARWVHQNDAHRAPKDIRRLGGFEENRRPNKSSHPRR